VLEEGFDLRRISLCMVDGFDHHF
jgi:hypothetical protein